MKCRIFLMKSFIFFLTLFDNSFTFPSTTNSTSKAKKNPFGTYSVVVPQDPAPPIEIPKDSGIMQPIYVTGKSEILPELYEIKTESQIKLTYESCKLARFVLNCVAEHIKVGMTTDEINEFAHELIISKGAYPSPLNFGGFPKSICTSVNNVACHGIPDSRPLENGDIITVDITVYLNGYHGDCAATFSVGDVDELGKKLIKVTRHALHAAISIVKPGERFSTIGDIIEDIARKNKLMVVGSLVGHGIGSYFHGQPYIYHTKNNFPGVMKAGMTFTIEPVLTQGNGRVVTEHDGWTTITEDASRTAQFEHTVLVTQKGYKVLTV